MSYSIGIDIGTFESKGVLVDAFGTIIADAKAAHKMIVPHSGWAEHRAEEDWWGDFVQITKSLLQKSQVDPQEIRAVATSAIGPCLLPVDAVGQPLTNGILYGVDTRALQEVAELTQALGADTILQRCGNGLTSQSVGPKIMWLQRNRPDIYEKARYFLTSTSYIVMRLTGEVVIDHYTAANFSPLYDVNQLDWCDDLAPGLARRDRLPRLLWSSEIAGRVTPAAAAATGLAIGTPVTCGTIDAAAEALSVGVTAPGDMMMMYGSTIFIIALTAAPVRDARLWYAPWLFPGLHGSMAGLATSGTLTHWFRDHLARDLAPDTAFAELATEASASRPGANGLIMLPYFSGERTPIHDPHAKGALFGLDLTHDRGDIYRALIEGIAYGTNHVMETYAAIGQRPRRLLAVGGGTKNPLWLQVTSDVSGLDQIVCTKTTGAAYGDAFLAALAVGLVEAGDIHRWNPAATTVVAQPNLAYAKSYRLFRQLYEQTKDIAASIAAPLA